jgi:hypothetical protein
MIARALELLREGALTPPPSFVKFDSVEKAQQHLSDGGDCAVAEIL